VAAGVGQVRQIGLAIPVARGTTRLGITDPQIDGSIRPQIAEVVQGAGKNLVARGRGAALGTGTLLVDPGPRLDLRRREILPAGKAFGDLGHLFARAIQGRSSQKNLIPFGSSGIPIDQQAPSTSARPVLRLQSQQI